MSKRTLFDLVSGDRARIVRVRGESAPGLRQRLLDMGITRGTELYVERHAPLGDPVEITLKGYSLALRMNEARYIEIEEL
jgi:ferrous iron transport protein A